MQEVQVSGQLKQMQKCSAMKAVNPWLTDIRLLLSSSAFTRPLWPVWGVRDAPLAHNRPGMVWGTWWWRVKGPHLLIPQIWWSFCCDSGSSDPSSLSRSDTHDLETGL